TLAPDGSLYFSVGRTCCCVLADGTGPLTKTRLRSGKIFRLASDGSVPPNNPLAGVVEASWGGTFGTGFESPSGLAFDQVTGRIFVHDAEDFTVNEINEVLPGADYGWPVVDAADAKLPVWSQVPDGEGRPVRMVAGGIFHPQVPGVPNEYAGAYF